MNKPQVFDPGAHAVRLGVTRIECFDGGRVVIKIAAEPDNPERWAAVRRFVRATWHKYNKTRGGFAYLIDASVGFDEVTQTYAVRA